MNKIEKVLLDSIKEMHGFILGFGNLDEKIIKSIDKNNKINEFILLSDTYTKSTGKSKSKRTKKIAYRKIRNRFKKKNVTNIIASYEELEKYQRRFISDSLFLAKDNIYLFIKNKDIDADIIKKRYERYHQECEMIPCRDGIIVKITKKNYKANKAKDTLYLCMNFMSDVMNFIGDLFVS